MMALREVNLHAYCLNFCSFIILLGETTFYPRGYNELNGTVPTHTEVRVNPVSTSKLIHRNKREQSISAVQTYNYQLQTHYREEHNLLRKKPI